MILYCILLYCTVLYYIISYYIVLYYIVLYYIILYYIIWYIFVIYYVYITIIIKYTVTNYIVNTHKNTLDIDKPHALKLILVYLSVLDLPLFCIGICQFIVTGRKYLVQWYVYLQED